MIARRVLLLGLGLFLLAGCSRSPRVAFYTLNTVAPATAPGPLAVSVALGPASLPALVDQPQLVVRTGPNQVDILEISRWASPLRDEIPRIIAADLSLLLPQARVTSYQNAGMTDYRAQVDIQRFELSITEGASLDALWSIRSVKTDTVKTGRTVVNEPAGAGSYDALVAAQSRALAAVSRDLAQALRSIAVP